MNGLRLSNRDYWLCECGRVAESPDAISAHQRVTGCKRSGFVIGWEVSMRIDIGPPLDLDEIKPWL